MSTTKLSVSIDRQLVDKIDRLVQARAFSSRSHVVQTAIQENLSRWDTPLFARESAVLESPAGPTLNGFGLASELDNRSAF